VQIRTEKMHRTAEFGYASHAYYKQPDHSFGGSSGKLVSSSMSNMHTAVSSSNSAAAASGSSTSGRGTGKARYRIPWLTCITEWQHEIKSSREFVGTVLKYIYIYIYI
jgi:(p)ppGpp synthase/HD superfamily hydrolase